MVGMTWIHCKAQGLTLFCFLVYSSATIVWFDMHVSAAWVDLLSNPSLKCCLWWLLSTHSCPQFSKFYVIKRIKLHTVDFGTSEQINSLQPVGQVAEFKFESKFEPLQVIWSWLQKAIPEDNRRFWLQNQMPSSQSSAPALLGRIRPASTNTGRCLIGSSRCRLLPARLKKMCYQSCNIDSVWESTRF